MSGEDLREAARLGKHATLKSMLSQTANPCSVDEYGLSALMYGVFNGHPECVKYLICNHQGIDKDGVKTSALKLQSCRGYTGTQ